ncbi:MAG: hypothetical protein ACOVP8_12725, partial [Phycisphaerales bacterium]
MTNLMKAFVAMCVASCGMLLGGCAGLHLESWGGGCGVDAGGALPLLQRGFPAALPPHADLGRT